MGFFDTFINLFRLSSPNARIYTFWGLTTVLLGSIIANYWWPGYSISAEGKKKLNFLRKKQIKGETEKTTVKIIPSPSVTAPPTTSVSTAQTTSTSTSTSTSTASNTLPGAPAHAASTPATSEVLKEQLPKKETPAAGGKLKTVVPPTPPSTPVDSPFVAPKVSVATSSTTVSLPTATVVKDTPKVHTETKATSTLKQTITEIEVKEVKEVPEVKPALNNNKHFVLETEPEEKTKERDAVIQEVHHPIQVEEIQPVVHRERVIKEVHQVIQPFHEEIIKAPKVIEREALPEHRAAEWEDTEEYKMKFEEGFKGIASEQSFESTQNVTIYNEPIVEEVIKKEIINVIQPVIRREIVEPTIVKITKPIYEEVHEEPVLFHKELEVKELGRTVEGLEHEKAQYFEVKKRVHTELDTEIKTTVEKKGLETKIVSNTIQTK